jgi:hypothetical protein
MFFGMIPKNEKTRFSIKLAGVVFFKLLLVLLFVARRGFEPRQTEPKSVVLPLYYRAIMECKSKI